jgi:putative PIN family toxin of toxin-antitoxin system
MAARYVLDTNLIISAIIFPESAPGRALRIAQAGTILASDATKLELIAVIERPRFDRYVDISVRRAVAAEYVRNSEPISISFPIRASRDPDDDKFLEVAVHGRADFIVTGDEDLLILNPFQGIAILSPAEFLARETEQP